MTALLGVVFFIAFVVPLASPEIRIGPIPIDAAIIALGLIMLVVAVRVRLKDAAPVLVSPYLLPFTLFLLAGLIITLTAFDPVQSFQMWLRYAAYFILVITVPLVLTGTDRIKQVISALVIAGVLSSMVGFYMFLFQPDVIQIGAYNLGPDIANRIAGTFTAANWLGEYLVIAITMAVAMFFTLRSNISKVAMVGGTAILLGALFLTYSRGSWLALGLALCVLLFIVKRWLLIPLAALAAGAAVALPGFSDRILSIFSASSGTAGFRTRLWEIYLGEFTVNPLTGTGLGNFLEAFTHYNLTHTITGMITPPFSAHNYYLGSLVDGGILGFLALALVLVTIFRIGTYLISISPRKSTLFYLNAGVLATFLGMLANGLTSSLYTHPRVFIVLWLIIGLQAALFFLTKKEAADRPSLTPVMAGSAVVRVFISEPRSYDTLTGSAIFTWAAKVQGRLIDGLDSALDSSHLIKFFRPGSSQRP